MNSNLFQSASLAVFSLLTVLPCPGGAQEKKADAKQEVDPLIQAYSVNNYSRVRTLGAARRNEPLASLLLSLTKVYDKTQSESVAKQGVEELGRFYANKDMPGNLRILAGLSYARCAQLMQDRKDIYGTFADKIEYRKVYQDILRTAPGSKEAVAAFLYLNPTSEEIDAYIRGFTGDRQLLVPLHLNIANQEIRTRQNYRKAVEHLKAAYQIGIVHPSIRRSTLFRIGYLYDKRMNDFKSALPFYHEYMKIYPLSSQSVVIQRFIKEKGEK